MFLNMFKAVFDPIVSIRKNERTKTAVMFFYFFSIIATVWMLKPVRNSLFLDELGAKNLRYVYMGEGLFLIGIVWAFVQFSKRVSRKALYSGVLIFFILCLILFWMLFRAQVPYLSAFFYVWASSYSIIMTTQFFTLANDIFNPTEAKRLFGLILSGGSIGGVLGGIMTRQLVGTLGTENLLLVITGFIGVCHFLLTMSWKHLTAAKAENLSEESQSKEKEEKSKTSESGRKLLMGSGYLMMILCLIMLAKITSTVVDNQFNGIVEISITGKDERTAFYGGFFGCLNALSFCMQLFVTGWVLRFLGVGKALWILPLGLTLGAVGSIFYPILLLGIALKAFDGSTNYSIQQATREVLYLPVPSRVRYRVKPMIDMLGYRAAKSLGGVYIALMAPLLGIADHRLGVLVLFFIPLWLFIVWRMKNGYSHMLREEILNRGKKEKSEEHYTSENILSELQSEDPVGRMQPLLKMRTTTPRKFAAIASFIHSWDRKKAREEVESIVHYEATAHSDEVQTEGPISNEEFAKLEDLLKIPEKTLRKKRGILNRIEKSADQRAVNLLLESLEMVQDHALRFMLVKSLDRIHEKNPSLVVNRSIVKSQIAREVYIYQQLQRLSFFYTKNISGETNSYLLTLYQALCDESMERIFCFLDLLYPQEIIETLYLRIRDPKNTESTKSHAIELLNNTLEPDVLKMVRPVLEEGAVIVIQEAHAISSLRNMTGSQDRWFVIAGAVMVAELGFDKKDEVLKSFLENSHLAYLLKKRAHSLNQ